MNCITLSRSSRSTISTNLAVSSLGVPPRAVTIRLRFLSFGSMGLSIVNLSRGTSM